MWRVRLALVGKNALARRAPCLADLALTLDLGKQEELPGGPAPLSCQHCHHLSGCSLGCHLRALCRFECFHVFVHFASRWFCALGTLSSYQDECSNEYIIKIITRAVGQPLGRHSSVWRDGFNSRNCSSGCLHTKGCNNHQSRFAINVHLPGLPHDCVGGRKRGT